MNCARPRRGSAPTTSCAAWSSAASGCCPSAARPTAWPSRASWSSASTRCPTTSCARFFDYLARDFSPDPQRGAAGARRPMPSDPNAQHLIALTQAAEPPRQELLRRLNRTPGGTAHARAHAPRAAAAPAASSPSCMALEADLLHLLSSSWFNPGFLQMRRVDWNSPAQAARKDHPPRGGARRSTAGTTCAAACSPTGAASPSSTRSCPTSR